MEKILERDPNSLEGLTETESGHGSPPWRGERRLSKRQEFHAGKFYVVPENGLGLSDLFVINPPINSQIYVLRMEIRVFYFIVQEYSQNIQLILNIKFGCKNNVVISYIDPEFIE